jgi:hypothetical protein
MDRGSEAVREIASTDYGDGLEVGSHAAANLKFLLPLCALYLSITVSVDCGQSLPSDQILDL